MLNAREERNGRGVGRNLEKGGQKNDIASAKRAEKFFDRKPRPLLENRTGGTRARRPIPRCIEDLSTSASRIGDQNGFITSLCMIFSKCKDY